MLEKGETIYNDFKDEEEATISWYGYWFPENKNDYVNCSNDDRP